MSTRLRRSLVLALTSSLGLLVISSLWHHEHSPALAGIVTDDHQSTNAQSKHSSEYCPVCLSHRLLTHTCSQAVAEAPWPVVSSYCAASASILPAAKYACSSEARAPPLC